MGLIITGTIDSITVRLFRVVTCRATTIDRLSSSMLSPSSQSNFARGDGLLIFFHLRNIMEQEKRIIREAVHNEENTVIEIWNLDLVS